MVNCPAGSEIISGHSGQSRNGAGSAASAPVVAKSRAVVNRLFFIIGAFMFADKRRFESKLVKISVIDNVGITA